ncbi:MAG TPA: HYR domain-containing protein [Acidimicrobiia bacterium]|nr:HYR domain-containing protein [Acidimicrobiia bacterium]
MTALVTVVAALGVVPARADEAVADGDNIVGVSTSGAPLAFGTVCAGTTVNKDIVVALKRSTSGAPNIFKNSSVATVTVGTVTGAGLSAAMNPPNTITLPSAWQSAPADTISPTVTSTVTLVAAASPGSFSGSIQYTTTGTASNNTAITRSATLSVTATVAGCDTTPPALNLPANITGEATSAAGRVVTYTATATDAAPASPAVTCAPASGSTFAIGTTTVNCSSTDTAGNTATGSFTVTVQDTTGPVISATPSNVTTEATSASGAVVTYTAPSASDAVDGARPVTCVPPSGSTIPLGSNTITCSASDTRGNTSSSSFTVTVQDTTGPTLTLPGAITAEATGPSGAAASYTATASDVVDGAITPSCAPSSGSTFALGTTSVSCTATDSHTNVSSGSFDVSVVDTTAPAVTVPASFSNEATGPSGAAVTYSASASDLVDGAITPTCSAASGSTFALGTTTVTCSATDVHGNTGSASFDLTVVDTTAPVLSLPADVTAEANGPSGLIVSYSATAGDLVDGAVSTSCVPASGSSFPVGVTTVTCSATDTAGNESTGDFTVSITDTTAPVVTTPDNIVLEATSADGAPATFSATANDIVDGSITPSCTPASDSTFALGTTTVTCSATDVHGNEASETFTVTVVDTTPPDIAGTPTDFNVEAQSAAGAVVTYTSPAATDLVDGPVGVTCDPASGSTFPLDVTTTVTCSATDNAGNLAASTFSVTVSDTSAPVLSLPEDLTEEATGPAGAAVSFSPSANDAVDGVVPVTCTPTSGSTFALGTATVDCGATDAHGNAASGSFAVTVQDTTAPALTLPTEPIVAEATTAAGAAVDYTASASDLVDGAVTPTCSAASGSTFALGTTTVECSATDVHGNTASGSFDITVQDTTAPALTVPGDITAEATGPAGAAVSYTASASDLVDGSVDPTCGPASGTTFALGTTTVSCSVTDTHGNSAGDSFSVKVQDTTAPTIDGTPTDLVQEATGPSGAVVTYTNPTATDIVDGSVSVSCDPSSGSTFPLDTTTTTTCTASDVAGNVGTSAFTVKVEDTQGPVLDLPSAITAEATGPTGADVAFSASGSDVVDGSVAVSCAPDSGSHFAFGSTTVNCSAADAHLNASGGSFAVTVQDTTAPALTLPADMTIEATGPSGAPVSYSATASDIVDGTLTPTCSKASGATFALGTTTVTCSVTDGHGNTSGSSFTVTVVDTTAPALTLPGNQSVIAVGPSGAPVSFSTSATDIVDGSVSVHCTPASGSTFAPGATTVNCSAADAHSNSAHGTFSVTVTFDISGGLLQPVNPNALNTVKNGSTVPLKWQVPSPSGGYITTTAIVSAFVLTQVNCASLSTTVLDAVDFTTTGGTSLRYDTTANQFIQNWQTPKKAGNCYRVDIVFVGGQKLTANFQLK